MPGASDVGLIRRGVRIGALVAVCLLAAPAAGWADRPCEPMRVEGFKTPVTPPPRPPASRDRQLKSVSLPVVVHYMRTGSGRDAEGQFTPQMLVELFGASGTVNAIWRQASVRLYLHGFERCDIRFEDFGLEENANAEVDSPARSAEGKERFRRINQRYNTPGFRGVDLYVWPGITSEGGYGDRWLDAKERLRAGAAWIDTDCVDNNPRDCDLLLAHEIGHFLGLCHSCTLGDPIPRVPCDRCLPDSMKKPNGTYTLKRCGNAPRRLMRADNMRALRPGPLTGKELDQCERRLANDFASKRLTTKTTSTGGTTWVAEASASCRETRSTW